MKTKYILGILAAAVLVSCTDNFEDYNTDTTGLGDNEIVIEQMFKPMQHELFHDYQTAQNLGADAYAGYMMSPTPFQAQYNLNYAFVDGWNNNAFKGMYNYVLLPIDKAGKSGAREKAPDLWAIALILKVEAMHRVTDKFGAIPYSKAGATPTLVPYDDQKDIYNQFFAELDTAVSNLETFLANDGGTPFQSEDLFFNGDYAKWIKFANSLRLRLAMHIVKADAATAKREGEKAMAQPRGLMATPADDAARAVTNGTSDLYMISHDWDDNRINASILSYLIGFNDPRLSIYAQPATKPGMAGEYIGIRIGTAIPAKDDYKTYASINTTTTFTQTKAQQLMCAAESWFLRAEASLRGWQGAGDAKTNYETGVRVSMQQWGVVDGATVDAYLADDESTQVGYVDKGAKTDVNDSAPISTITIAWDETSSNEVKLERIMTQKWIAMFPEGMEAWTEFRRTGYPKLFPVVNNLSNGTIDTDIQVRRLAYPTAEYSTNGPSVQDAVSRMGGADNGGTRLWWDVDKANF
ncbi:SusD/RagB family nutrient-binding outer membrane lipoprotein [Dawidia soli]|uniref:SusD/RagB family nutrient-binding outer membrane lipoprotein n=1 Tax=Dawidia soli TaxID=2782352 RepID=A0AAP2D6C9_9BACT|nr:SusD/RagB family nutrient-binding outer membrane lipoprotein [Dawidia soli]MBT1685889.1 SusD/RagB family nutrient-binding outer membrane lipoprotein [Dawidia soli]